jgi:tripartite ATP-independent transporter DctP family solute receptor
MPRMEPSSSLARAFRGLALVVGFLLAGCEARPDGDLGPARQRLILANVHVEGYPTARGLQQFAAAVRGDEVLGRELEIDLQLGGVLGNEKELLEKLRFGGVQMACVSVAPLTEFSRQIGVLTLPYLFADADAMWRALESPLGRELLDSVEDAGFVGLAWYDAGARSFYNRRRPVRRLEDLSGLKIRVQKSEMMRQMVEALGASPVSIGFKDVYTNLLTGNIDGAENNLSSYRSERHFEAAKFYSQDRHTMIPDLLLVNAASWQELPAETRAALRRAAEASTAAQRRFWSEYETEALELLRQAGVEIHEIADLEPFRRAVEPLYERHRDRYGDLVRRLRRAARPPGADPPAG